MYVIICKIDIFVGNLRNLLYLCLIYKGLKYIINECIVFWFRSLENRKVILCNYNICLKCCEIFDYFVIRCKLKIYCDICEESDFYCIVFYLLEDL